MKLSVHPLKKNELMKQTNVTSILELQHILKLSQLKTKVSF